MAYVNADFGVGAYSEGPWVFADDRFGYSLGQGAFFPVAN